MTAQDDGPEPGAAAPSARLDAVRAGGKPALARALADVERRADAEDVARLLDAAWTRPLGPVIGLTGPPGVGKSTLLGALTAAERAAGRRVAVLAVDPSSKASGGALLGDRLRLARAGDDGLFIRSLAARDRQGGLAELAFPAMTLLRACFDTVFVETVGVGQSETDIAALADVLLFCAQPGAGDAIQFMKAGVMETPDIVAVTKADMGPSAQAAAADARAALSLAAPRRGRPPADVALVSAVSGDGVAALCDRLRARAAPDPSRADAWVDMEILYAFGRQGAAACAALLRGAPDLAAQPPFARRRALARELARRLSTPVSTSLAFPESAD